MTKRKIREIRKYLNEVRRRQCDFSIDAAVRQADVAKLDGVITDLMVASVELEGATDWIILHTLELKARSCREICLKLISLGRQN